MKRTAKIIITLAVSCLLFSCGEMKTIPKGNYVFRYEDRQNPRVANPDRLHVYEVNTTFKAKIDDKTDYLMVKNNVNFTAKLTEVAVYDVPNNAKKIAIKDKFYTNENELLVSDTGAAIDLSGYNGSFTYYDNKFAIQTLTIPLKFRRSVEGELSLPSQAESGFNIGLAPVMKWNKNVFNPIRKTFGKVTNTYSVNTGLLFTFGATDLKAATNAPGLVTDRKAATFTYGGIVTIGINNVHIGYAIGADRILGTGSENWLYQNRLWHGFIFSLDIIKP